MQALQYAVMTGSTCGDACWHANEDVCRCSCGGVNHGILRDGNADRPLRTSRILGHMYELVGVTDYGGAFEYEQQNRDHRLYRYSDDKRGWPFRSRKASADQVKRWPELAQYRGMPPHRWQDEPYLLWKRTDA